MEDKYEIARVISARTFQLAVGAKPTVKVKADEKFEEVARKEMEAGTIPLKVLKRRKKR